MSALCATHIIPLLSQWAWKLRAVGVSTSDVSRKEPLP
jgi:hypothetical protein